MWGPVAHGFLARGGTLLESLTVLVEHGMEGEAQMILRILFEHVTTFCWLAIDPERHVEQWREWADSRRLKVHKDAKRFGIEVLTPAEVEQFKSAKPPLPLPQLAQTVDEHWSEVSTALSALRARRSPHPHVQRLLHGRLSEGEQPSSR